MNNDSRDDMLQSNEILELLKSPEALAFLEEHWNERPESLALKYRNRTGFNLSKLTQLLQLYEKARHKLPLWVERRCALTPKSYEQSTHQMVAQYKVGLFAGQTMLDMTSGLGVDAYYFSKRFESVTCLDANQDTCTLSRFNAERLGVNNIQFVHERAEDFRFNRNFDLIYIDPDRRPESDIVKKQVALYTPNILEMHHLLLKHAKQVVIKLSPMVDLQYIEKHFDHLSKTYVIAYKNEVKEVLVLLENNARSSIERHAIDLRPDTSMEIHQAYPFEQPKIQEADTGKYLYEPSRAVIKSGMSNHLAAEFNLNRLSDESLFYFSDQFHVSYQGRCFEVIHQFDFSWKTISRYLKAQKIKQVNIVQRNFFEDVRTIRNKLKVAAGGNDFLMFSTNQSKQAVCYYAKPLKTNL